MGWIGAVSAFEAPLREAPQDEAFFLNALNTVPSC